MANEVINAAANQALKKQLLKGATADQKTAIKYFIPDTGCASIFSKISDEDYKKVVEAVVASSNHYKRALDKIGLDESELQEIPPVTLVGYDISNFSKVTATGHYISNLYSITHLFFSSTQVYMYQLILNTMKNEKKERTEEYFYKDITNFSTSTDTTEAFTYKGCSGTPNRVSSEIQRFSLIVPGDKFSCSTDGDIEASVKAMKNKLREKKM